MGAAKEILYAETLRNALNFTIISLNQKSVHQE
jgi:hypothetical protein